MIDRSALMPLADALQVFGDASLAMEAGGQAPRFTAAVHGRAVLAVLAAAMDSGDRSPPIDQDVWDLVPLMMIALDDPQVDMLLVDVLFTTDSPAVYSAIAPGIWLRVAAGTSESAVLRQLQHGDERARSNALEFVYFVFDANPDYRMSEAGLVTVRAAK